MKKKLFLYFLCIVIIVLVIKNIIILLNDDFIEEDELEPIKNNIDSMNILCYNQTSTSDSLPSIDGKLDTDRNIFFHETSCFDENDLALNPRQACAVESAAKMNPDMNVYVLFLSPSKVSRRFRKLLKQLQTYPNIYIRRIKPEDYMKNTPLDAWYKTEILKKSKWPINHMSDILRYLTLWKYGGIYLDLDIVVIKPIKYLANFAGAEDKSQVAAGIIGFDASMIGRRMANECIQEIRSNFRGDIWSHNGPGVITRILKKICSTKNLQDMSMIRCKGFKIYPSSTFYPIHYGNWKSYFQTTNKDATMKKIEEAITIHVWNKLSNGEKVNVNSDVPYVTIARKYCPKILNNCGKIF